ncbi:MAG: DUF3299 domain-containing protein [Pirellulales bacterium]|nr:DUF3299 domain-containing protein [Pirellulales bacterium]
MAARDPGRRFNRPIPTEAPLAPKVVRPTRKAVSTPGGSSEITFDAIKFDIDKGEAFERSMIPASIEALLGQRIKIRGYILPSFQQRDIKQFVLVRDNMECCFGPGAALYDCIVVDMLPGRATSYTTRPIAVEGKFTINEVLGADGEHLAIFHLDGESTE